MEHVLDNPAWNALLSGNKDLSYGNARVKYFDKQVSPFVACDENTDEHFLELHSLLPANSYSLFVATTAVEIPAPWKIIRVIPGYQMVCGNANLPENGPAELVDLTYSDVPQMMELTKLTDPGPFAEKTIDFGHYKGIFDGDQLVAMAGQRMHPPGYAEISAVCTRPGHNGKGYARQLLANQVNRITASGEIPILHVKSENERAVKVYESLGFVTRKEVWFTVIWKG